MKMERARQSPRPGLSGAVPLAVVGQEARNAVDGVTQVVLMGQEDQPEVIRAGPVEAGAVGDQDVFGAQQVQDELLVAVDTEQLGVDAGKAVQGAARGDATHSGDAVEGVGGEGEPPFEHTAGVDDVGGQGRVRGARTEGQRNRVLASRIRAHPHVGQQRDPFEQVAGQMQGAGGDGPAGPVTAHPVRLRQATERQAQHVVAGGAGRVVVQDIADWQRDRALAMGADAFIADASDPVGASDGAFPLGKPDVVFECVGIPGLIAQAVQQVRNRGTILLLGLCTRPDTFNSFAMLQKEVRLVTSAFFTRQDYEDALDALSAGAVEPRLMVTETIGLEQVPDMFAALKQRTQQCKVLIAP